MLECLGPFRDLVVSTFKSRARLEAENLILRHQLSVYRRAAPRRPRLTNLDRLVFIWLYRVYPGVVNAVTVIRRERLVRWPPRGLSGAARGAEACPVARAGAQKL